MVQIRLISQLLSGLPCLQRLPSPWGRLRQPRSERGRGRGLYVTVAILFSFATLQAQPITPAETTTNARYVFTVYTPTSQQEAMIWQTPETQLTTHRARLSDSTEIRLSSGEHTVLRTFVDLGADAGAVEVNEEQGSPTLHEMLCYDYLLSPEQRQLTESYLAIKHGLTLNQSLPTNYLTVGPDGEAYPVWTATTERAFRHRIFGLALDASVGLQRLTGSSVLAPDLVRLSWPQTPAATAYLLLADDDAPTALGEFDPELPGVLPLQRRWRVEAHGDVPENRVEIAIDRLFARLEPGNSWVVLLVQALAGEETTTIAPCQLENGKISFNLPPGTTHFQLAQTCTNCSVQVPTAENHFFASALLSPNPVRNGQATQLRVSLAETSALVLTAYDALGREVFSQTLPPNTHHLTELTFPAPGTYSLHLRPRLKKRSAPQRALKVVVH